MHKVRSQNLDVNRVSIGAMVYRLVSIIVACAASCFASLRQESSRVSCLFCICVYVPEFVCALM